MRCRRWELAERLYGIKREMNENVNDVDDLQGSKRDVRVPIIVQPDRKHVSVLLVLDRFERHGAFATSIEIVPHELEVRMNISHQEKSKGEEHALSHLNTISTSLSLKGFISLGISDNGGINNPSITVKISFQTLNITISFAESLKYVFNVGRFASKKSNNGDKAASNSTSVRSSGRVRGFSEDGRGI